jgi:hypothetical protein
MLSREFIGVAFAACTLMACNRSTPRDDNPRYDTVTTTNALVARAPGMDIATAVNASIVKRFSDESSLAHTTSKLIDAPTTARATPYGGEVVALMTNGAEVTEVAKEGDCYLVLFNDPNDVQSDRKMAGWIYKDALMGPAADMTGTTPTSPTSACTSDQAHVLSDDSCRTQCVHDSDCEAAGGVCDGSGQLRHGSDDLVQEGRYCVSAIAGR